MNARITHLSISNFRSIRGTLEISLDSPVVLIHGPNGSGKTSLLSAIELGLTGKIESLRRLDKNYQKYLVNSAADCASVAVRCKHQEIDDAQAEVRVEGSSIEGAPLLTSKQSRFYTERCFLAQTTLSRLLETYEATGAQEDANYLTKFVKDLLGLDQLDHIIDGLYHLGHVSRLRRSLPLFAEIEHEASRLDRELESLSDEVNDASDKRQEAQVELQQKLALLELKIPLDTDKIEDLVFDADDDESIRRLSALKHEIAAAKSLLAELASADSTDKLYTAETELSQAEDAYDSWDLEHGERVEAALKRARSLVKGLPSPEHVGFKEAHEAAVGGTDRELTWYRERKSSDDAHRRNLGVVRDELAKAMARLDRLNAHLATLADDSGQIARALSEIAPFVKDEVCPVCDRNYAEHSDVPLYTHLAERISSLTQTVSDLQQATSERQATIITIENSRLKTNDLRARLLNEQDRSEILGRIASLEELREELKIIAVAAETGSERHDALRRTSRALNALRQSEKNLLRIRESVAEFPIELDIASTSESESINDTLERCEQHINERQAHFEQRRVIRMSAREIAREYKIKSGDLDALLTRKHKIEAEKHRLDAALERAYSTWSQGKQLARSARQVRAKAVRHVFNERLNETWRDLFVRLAPDEPFIPALSLRGKKTGQVQIQLETRDQEGNPSGNPKAILSAGNLNTAALTLFLSLHLSMKPILPWLIIDDPVQSMDEIHISQFAALLRTLSRQNNRQVIIAVHDRPLFDYLALELSPASDRDRLITIELSKAVGADTQSKPRFLTWDPDTVLQVSG